MCSAGNFVLLFRAVGLRDIVVGELLKLGAYAAVVLLVGKVDGDAVCGRGGYRSKLAVFVFVFVLLFFRFERCCGDERWAVVVALDVPDVLSLVELGVIKRMRCRHSGVAAVVVLLIHASTYLLLEDVMYIEECVSLPWRWTST